MTLVFLETAAIILSLGFVLYFSSVEMAVHQANAVTLRMLLERGSGAVRRLASLAQEDRAQLLLPLHLGTQTAFIAVVVLTVHLCILEWGERGVWYSLGIVLGLNLVFRQLLPRLCTFHAPERKLVRLLSLIYPLYMLLHSLAFPLVGILKAFQRLHQRTQPELSAQESEASEEEIQAYLDIGEDEGILEEEDSELIQSVVEFGDTVVREVMTPRTRIIGCSETATLSELRDIMVNHRHSRIPIFRGDLDHIVGAAYIRQLLASYTHGRESEPITDLIQPAFFVPETKRVSALLNELQERAGHLAVVIDEFGGVAGLVTIEDLVEEIVGEIRDEDQVRSGDVVEEEPRSYVLPGSTELYRLEELSGRKFDGMNCSTVGGLVTATLGRVPAPGEGFELDGLRIQVLDSDRKRVRKVRVRLAPAAADQAEEAS